MGVQNLFTLHFGNSSRLNNLTTKSILTPYRSFWWYHAAFLSRLILSSHSFFSKFPFFSQHLAELLFHVGEVERKIVIWQQEKCARLKTERSPYASLQACWQSLEWRFILDLVNSRFVFFSCLAMVAVAARASESVWFQTKHGCKNASLLGRGPVSFLKKVLPKRKH